MKPKALRDANLLLVWLAERGSQPTCAMSGPELARSLGWECPRINAAVALLRRARLCVTRDPRSAAPFTFAAVEPTPQGLAVAEKHVRRPPQDVSEE